MRDRPPTDPADHAEEFAHRWVDRLENAVEGRMHALEVPEPQIGSSDHQRGVAWRTFFPHERDAGGNSPGGRLSVDSGVLNPEWNASRIGEEASAHWKRSRLRHRIDATIAHEFEEAKGGSHDYAIEYGPETELPVSDEVRALLRSIRRGEQSR